MRAARRAHARRAHREGVQQHQLGAPPRPRASGGRTGPHRPADLRRRRRGEAHRRRASSTRSASTLSTPARSPPAAASTSRARPCTGRTSRPRSYARRSGGNRRPVPRDSGCGSLDHSDRSKRPLARPHRSPAAAGAQRSVDAARGAAAMRKRHVNRMWKPAALDGVAPVRDRATRDGALAQPGGTTAATAIALQGKIGNRAVGRLLAGDSGRRRRAATDGMPVGRRAGRSSGTARDTTSTSTTRIRRPSVLSRPDQTVPFSACKSRSRR